MEAPTNVHELQEANFPKRNRSAMSTEPELTEQEKQILRHALTGGTKEVYRNHFVAGPGHTDYAACESMAERGLMIKYYSPLLDVDDKYFRCTAEGAAKVGLTLPASER
jgi:hypothetical protein